MKINKVHVDFNPVKCEYQFFNWWNQSYISSINWGKNEEKMQKKL